MDIGGSKTRGVRFEGNMPVRDVTVGSANVQNVSPDVAVANLAELFRDRGGRQVDEIYVGAGGVDTDEDARALASLIRQFVPDARITVVHDSRLLLAAAGVNSGVAVISGTGSAVWGRNDKGEEARFGGWGFLLGDEGSGYWLGREAVRYSLRRMNQGHKPDELTSNLLAACGTDDPARLIALFHSPRADRSYWAGHARLVVDAAQAGHQPSLQLMIQCGKDLAEMTARTLDHLGLAGPVVLGGGLGMNVALVQTAFCAALAALAELGVTDVRVLTQDPVFGTTHLAAQK
jgi:N-acetylglucosamine kinase-like BadF-type ATPase